jgi:pectate disaccharide-lyase
LYKSIGISVLIAASGYACAGRVTPAPSSFGDTLYVATTGADSNTGSKEAPFRTIQHAANLARPGMSVHVAAGTYRENVTTKVHGAPTARIRFVSDTKWGARIVGSGTESVWNNQADYIDIVGFDISGTGRIGVLNLASHTLIQGNHVHDMSVSGGCTSAGGAGIHNGNYNASDSAIIGNVVHDIGVPGACAGIHGIYVTNLRSRIFNNIVYRASSWGIHLWHAADHVTIANNTVFENGSAKMGGGIITGVGDRPGGKILTDTLVVNNIVYNNPAKGIAQFCYPGEDCIGHGNVVANNLVYGSAMSVVMKVGKAIGTIVDDPQFVDYQAKGGGNYRLKHGSPAIKKGLASFAPSTDIEHVARPPGAAPDIGAYESK